MPRKKNVGVIDTDIMTKIISVKKSHGKVLKRKMKHTALIIFVIISVSITPTFFFLGIKVVK